MANRKRGLGRGLSSLISQPEVPAERDESNADAPAEAPEGTPAPDIDTEASEGDGLRYLPIDQVEPGQYQPRQHMQEGALEELATSIRSQGVIEPIVVRPISSTRYELIAGERRWRAAQLAGLQEIPAVVRAVSDEDAIAMALIENIQREDLNPVEEATALQRLQKEFSLTQQDIADIVGKNRATVANLLRLLNLMPDVRKLLEDGDIEMGHARALLSLTDQAQSRAAGEVVRKGLTVRATEALVKHLLEGKSSEKNEEPPVDANIKRLEQTLAERLGASVAIRHGQKGKGSLVIQYNSLDELDGILGHIR